MADRQLLFTLDYAQFNEILSHESWFNLQEEFRKRSIPFSQSFLIWEEERRKRWLLADFETNKTYDIEQKTEAEEPPMVEIWELSSQEKRLTDLNDPETILSHFQQGIQGTHEGFIDFLKKIDLEEVNLEGLKRSDLSGAGFSFEFGHQDLLNTHNMFREILTASRESLTDLSRGDLREFANYLRQFYEYAEQINSFEIKGENPSQNYNSLLQTISEFCENTKGPLRQHIAYLNSKKVRQLDDQVRTILTDAEEKFNTETEKLQNLGEEAQQKEEKRQESFDQLYIQLQNQLAEKPISQYKAIFETQAKNHRTMAWVWFVVSGLLVLCQASVEGYSFLSLILASSVVNRQWTVARC